MDPSKGGKGNAATKSGDEAIEDAGSKKPTKNGRKRKAEEEEEEPDTGLKHIKLEDEVSGH